MYRRLHNDAVALPFRFAVDTWYDLPAGQAFVEPRPFEMAEVRFAPDGRPAGFASFLARVRPPNRLRSRAASSCSRRIWPTVIVLRGRELGWPCER